MVTLITIVHVFVCFFLILVVLLQAGKGGGMGIAFGSSTSSQVFGGRGAGSFLEKLTAGTAVVFMATSITLAYFASQSDSARLQRMSAQKHKEEQKQADKAADERAVDVGLIHQERRVVRLDAAAVLNANSLRDITKSFR